MENTNLHDHDEIDCKSLYSPEPLAHLLTANRAGRFRFAAMLTANSIIIAILGWTFASDPRLPVILAVALPIFGLLLCVLWWNFNDHGLKAQDMFNKEGQRLEEKYFSDIFNILRRVPLEQNPCKIISWPLSYRCVSRFVIVLFGIIYTLFVIVTVVNLVG